MELFEMTAHELHDLLVRKEVSAKEITQAVLGRVAAVEDKVKSYITLTPEAALAQAADVDKQIAAGETIAPLAGIPAAVKDVFCTEGVETTCAAKILQGFIPPYNATVMDRLQQNGMVMIGKTNCDEFAMGSSTENSAFFKTHNPWDLSRVPGGSSGGSAAAVPAGEAIYSLGSDTGGSIRQPAAFCGTVGMKPTYGRVSRYGLIALASSLDQAGPFTKDVTDCALVMNAIAGSDPQDATAATVPVPDYRESLKIDVKGLKIGVPKEHFGAGIAPDVRQAITDSIELLTSLGATAEEVSLPHSKYALATYYIIQSAEASSNLARYDGVRHGYRTPEAEDVLTLYSKTRSEGFGKEPKRRIMLGTLALSAEYYDACYLKAMKVRTLIRQDFERAFADYDVLITPVAPTVAFGIGEKMDDPLQMYMSDICTIPINLAGIPGLSIPCGFSNGLPIGLQILGKPFSEPTLLRTAYTLEQNSDYHKVRPQLGR
ncbi:MAG: Asp-tRNA(Asn)/Glu-tRNA(Gln) amidotransferase subunit GatA [bacterium]|jgi:aspartyl-tRNA(Asn)/glutamyl-tRNA(Gln) amidotransferase subunit A